MSRKTGSEQCSTNQALFARCFGTRTVTDVFWLQRTRNYTAHDLMHGHDFKAKKSQQWMEMITPSTHRMAIRTGSEKSAGGKYFFWSIAGTRGAIIIPLFNCSGIILEGHNASFQFPRDFCNERVRREIFGRMRNRALQIADHFSSFRLFLALIYCCSGILAAEKCSGDACTYISGPEIDLGLVLVGVDI